MKKEISIITEGESSTEKVFEYLKNMVWNESPGIPSTSKRKRPRRKRKNL